MTEPLDDATAYRRLLAMSQELEALGLACGSIAAITAACTASVTLRTLASGLYKARLEEIAEREGGA